MNEFPRRVKYSCRIVVFFAFIKRSSPPSSVRANNTLAIPLSSSANGRTEGQGTPPQSSLTKCMRFKVNISQWKWTQKRTSLSEWVKAHHRIISGIKEDSRMTMRGVKCTPGRSLSRETDTIVIPCSHLLPCLFHQSPLDDLICFDDVSTMTGAEEECHWWL